MKLAPAQLGKHLQGPLAPVYVISGDDPLLCQEAADAIRAAARQQGFDERQVFSADANFDWGTLLQAGASMSLFAEKRLLELRLPSGKPGDKGAAAFIEYCSRPAEDTLLLVSLPKLDGSAQKTKWGKALIEGEQTQFIQIWPVDANQLPQWIRQRLSQAGLSANQDAVDLIAARVEGNLLAAAQEIEKLKLMAEGGQITAETVQAAVADSARFDVFGLVDAVLNGEAAHALRMLEGLRGEGVEPPVILWALSRELRALANMSLQYSQGTPLDKVFSQARPPVWDKRKPLMSKALQRYSAPRWAQLLLDAQRIDAQIKGQATGSPWSSLSRLSLLMAGQRLPLPAE
ncbi:DNA polymerase III subunit delta [Pseudomonas chlororaphis]|uniref:DNA polymerase III subunit delta n=1 Tax=Pseudomonas chlororaphis TaxID=587753 RepID=A0A0D5XUB4_9PSED|nr:DNA polymerase III subunit delta [Pseudomonas chlororaphis]AKA22279.1 DNA polymerase III subunit delta [Pseudomonas chlororaphis]MCB2252571.1 DNA polymerase III subunit delta [Pseudomonas chlororaphis]